MAARDKDTNIASHIELVEDIDALAPVMADGLEGDYVQLEPGRFRGSWTTVALESLVIQFADEGRAVLRRLKVPQNRWAFIVPLAISVGARWNGHTVDGDDIVVCPAGSECLAFDPASTRFAVITAALTSPVVAAARSRVTSSPHHAVMCAGAGTAGLRERLDDVLALAQRRQFEPLAGVLPTIDAALAAVLAQADTPEPQGTSLHRSGIVSRVEEFLRDHVNEGVSIGELSSVAGVSERSLRNAFHDVYATSPKRYMRLWQLHRVHHALRSGNRGAATVTEAATNHGFFELGRFAGAYKSLFGEAPSQTLTKARHRRIAAA